jgi:hypothetical protein
MFLIQGVFFQNVLGLGITMDPAEGVRSIIRDVPTRFMYAGAIWEHESSGLLVGRMQDSFGLADLSDILISDTEIRFTKQYEHQRDVVEYTFRKKENGTWEGEYKFNGGAIGSGPSRCIITQVPDGFLTF